VHTFSTFTFTGGCCEPAAGGAAACCESGACDCAVNGVCRAQTAAHNPIVNPIRIFREDTAELYQGKSQVRGQKAEVQSQGRSD
jgi:hypothetical protein